MRRLPRRPAPVAAVALLTVLAALTAGCGIRTTSVPVDAGPAPSRVSCAVPTPQNSPDAMDAQVVQVYLVCGMQTTPVPRTVEVRVRVRPYGRVEQVRELVAQLQRSVLGAEAKAGFATAVPGTLEVAGPDPGDPADAVRLGQPIEDLPSFALAQIVCTIGMSPLASPGHSVILGGSEDGTKVRRYTCTPDLRTRPQAADTAGTEVP